MKIRRFSIPRFQLWQQIILYFVLAVLIPMVGITLIIYNISQKALEKELVKFTEHSVQAIYKDMTTEMSWQHKEAVAMKTYLLRTYNGGNFGESAQGMFAMDPDYDAVGLYDAKGVAIDTAYRQFNTLSPEMRLPAQLDTTMMTRLQVPVIANPTDLKNTKNPAASVQAVGNNGPVAFDVQTFDAGDPKENPYYLRTAMPVPNAPTVRGHHVAYYMQLKSFNYLTRLINANSVYDGLYIVDKDGFIIAAPGKIAQGDTRRHISPDDYRFFQKLRPGVTEEFSTKSPTVAEVVDKAVNTAMRTEDSNVPRLEKVFLKIPDINWGIIIESPYQIRQVYVRRAHMQSLVLVAATLVLVIILSISYAYGINRNFRQLIKGIQAMAMGNYSRRIRLITNVVTPHEIIYVTGEFNRMARQMSEAWSDIQEANKKLAQMDELKSNLIDTVSHELRTPLTSIKGYTSRLLRYDHELDADTRKKSLRVVKQQADRLGRLVEDLLVIPDLESATLRVFPDQVDLDAVIEQSVQSIQAKDHREITVRMPDDADENAVIHVLADPDRLEQILLNLLDNAAKYSPPETPIVLTVETIGEYEMAKLTVENQCPPLPEDVQENPDQLFEKFKRLDESLVRTTRGSGLGLFITKGLVEAMGGRIELYYSDGHFITMFTVPLYNESMTRESVHAG